jgi:hypothetical protein
MYRTLGVLFAFVVFASFTPILRVFADFMPMKTASDDYNAAYCQYGSTYACSDSSEGTQAHLVGCSVYENSEYTLLASKSENGITYKKFCSTKAYRVPRYLIIIPLLGALGIGYFWWSRGR